jgi:hypothetical protein
MEYRIEIEENATQRIIHTTIIGTMSEKERNRIGMETVRKMRHDQISKVIWDIREAKLAYPLIGSHQAVLNLGTLGVQSQDRVAVIYFHDQKQHQHAKNVAFNRGILNIDYFQNLEEGIQWLLAIAKLSP